MSQAGRSKSHLSYFTRKKPRPTSNLHPKNKGTSTLHGHSSEPTTPTFGNQDTRSSPKKSLLVKVKEKATKLRQLLAKKRYPRKEKNPTPPEEAKSQMERDEKATVRGSTPRSDVATDACNSSASEMKSTLKLSVDTSATASVSNPSDKETEAEKSNNKVLQQPVLDNAGAEHITIPEAIVIPTRLNNPAFKEKSVDDNPVRKDSTSSMGKGNNKVLRQLASDNAAVEYINIPETAAVPTSLNNPAINEKSSDEILVRKDNSSMENGNSEVLQQLALDNTAVEHITIPETTCLKDPTINEKSSNEIPVNKCSTSTCMEKGNNEDFQQLTLDNTADEHITIPDIAVVVVPTSLNNTCINEKSKVEIPVSIDRSSTEKANNEVLQQPTLDNPAVEHLTIQDTAVTPTNLNNPAINERFQDEIPVSKERSRVDKENNEVLQQTLDNAAVEHYTTPDNAVLPTSLSNRAMNEKSSDEIPDSKDSRRVENGKSGALQQPAMDSPAFNYVTIPETALRSTSVKNPTVSEKSSNEVPVIKERSSSSCMEEGNNAVFQKVALDNNAVEYTTAPETATTPTSLNATINKKSKDERSVRTNRSSTEKGNNEVLQQQALYNAAVGYVNVPESAMKPTSLNPSTNKKSSDEVPVSKDSNSSSMQKGNSKVLQQLALENVAVGNVTITEMVPIPTSHNPVINKKSLDEIPVIKDRSSGSNNNNSNTNNKNDSNRYSRSNSCKTLSKTVTDMLSPAYFMVSGATQAITSKIQKSAGPDSNRYSRSNSCKALGKTVTDMLSPAYTVVSGATQAIASKIQGSSGPVYEIAAKQVWDKSTSVKDYLMQKLEPGEEDKALCNVITAAVSPKCVSPASEEVATVNNEVVLIKGEIEGSAIAAIRVPAN